MVCNPTKGLLPNSESKVFFIDLSIIGIKKNVKQRRAETTKTGGRKENSLEEGRRDEDRAGKENRKNGDQEKNGREKGNAQVDIKLHR